MRKPETEDCAKESLIALRCATPKAPFAQSTKTSSVLRPTPAALVRTKDRTVLAAELLRVPLGTQSPGDLTRLCRFRAPQKWPRLVEFLCGPKGRSPEQDLVTPGAQKGLLSLRAGGLSGFPLHQSQVSDPGLAVSLFLQVRSVGPAYRNYRPRCCRAF